MHSFGFKKYSGEAIVLSRRSIGEADRILDLYTKEYGKLSVVAKGIRKPKSRKRGSLEVFSFIKFSAAKGKSLDILTEVETIDNLGDVRDDLKKVALAYYFVEVIEKTTKDGHMNLELFAHIQKYLSLLRSKDVGLKRLKKDFVYNTLVTLGYWPKGRRLIDEETAVEEVAERKISSVRVGRKLLT